MGRFTYYLPLLCGIGIVLLLNGNVRDQWPAARPAVQWLIVAGAALGLGMLLQSILIGTQGAFAQVLPVPGGRTIRGGGAQTAGWLLLGGLLLVCATAVMWHEAVGIGAMVVGGLAGACLLGAVGVYVWSLPTALRDFADD